MPRTWIVTQATSPARSSTVASPLPSGEPGPGASAAPGSAAEGSVDGDTAHLFQSKAEYYEPAGAVSWDVAMTVTPPDWRVQVKKGDVLSTQTTYDVSNASWSSSVSPG